MTDLWPAPTASTAVDAVVDVPGSKSMTARALTSTWRQSTAPVTDEPLPMNVSSHTTECEMWVSDPITQLSPMTL